jgi:hypothetical protein
MTDDGYLSKNRPYLAAMQRQRRARMVRIDYMPGKAARDAIEAMRARSQPRTPSATNSAVIDAIVAEWARLTGINYSDLSKPKTPANLPGLSDTYTRARMTTDARSSTRAHESPDDSAKCAPVRVGVSPAVPEFIDAFARANESGLCHATRAGAQANKSGSLPAGANQARVICGARRRRDGEPCQGLSVPGKRRCKWHGGASTGPRTDEGRARSLANLQQNRSHDAGSA